ncbi:MAG: hypothetical protein CVT88_00950 [Candidatus Altiarchaeales archaeon HGW-Altiarchaeales-1]|nr:MAG: hypothetical protein CVT88_00950 [Candidatus Altiarchaeales archaeon HGW-Altiarchaeales-1]
MLTKMIINNCDFEIVRILIENEKMTLKEIQNKVQKSRISVYKSLNKMESLGVIDKRKNLINLRKNPLTIAFSNLITEDFPLEYLTGRKLNILIELIDGASVSELCNNMGISLSSAYRNIREILPVLTESSGEYGLNDKNKTLIEFLRHIKNRAEFQSGTIVVWKKHFEKFIMTKKAILVSEAVLTGFSRFSEFGVEYHTIYDYYFSPKKDVSIEEILVHAIKSAKDANMLSMCIIFYLKNKERIDIFKVESQSKKYNVLNLWIDIAAYIEGTETEIKNKGMFLPKSEFIEKANVYNVSFVIKYRNENLFSIFDEISAKTQIKNKIKIYMLGGGALILYGIKETTKDIDIIVENHKDFDILEGLFLSANFHEVADVTPAYKNLCTSTILERENSPRIDIFIKKVCGGIVLTNSLKSRAKLEFEKNNFKIYILSPEDIFLFKAYSSREGDIIDCERILSKKKLDWEIILNEYKKQQKNMSAFWGNAILDHIEMLETRTGIKIPITKKLARICLENAILYITKKPKTINEIKKEIDFNEYMIRNTIKRLINRKKIKKINERPIKFVTVN